MKASIWISWLPCFDLAVKSLRAVFPEIPPEYNILIIV